VSIFAHKVFVICFILLLFLKVVNETWGSSRNRVKDYTLYTGVLGTAYLVFKAYQVTKNVDDLNLCLKIVKACDSTSENSRCYLFHSSDKT
jgi:uncharacterized membrane protein YdcZ (DUF606 family)